MHERVDSEAGDIPAEWENWKSLEASGASADVALPHRYLVYWLFNPEKLSGLFQKVLLVLKSGTIHWIASGWGPGMWAQQEQCSPARIVSGAGSLKSPGKRGGVDFSPRLRQRACQDPLTRQGGDALTWFFKTQKSKWRHSMTYSCTLHVLDNMQWWRHGSGGSNIKMDLSILHTNEGYVRYYESVWHVTIVVVSHSHIVAF
jgi:hypothetical protein